MEHGTYRSRKPMKKHVTITLFSLALSFLGTAQTLIMLKPVKMKKWGVPAANYSGIAHLGGDRYAVVSDKQTNDGYYEFRIVIDGTTGKVKDIKLIDFHKNENKSRDAEGICYANGKIYISAEDDQRIIEYDEKGHRTGRELAVPEGMTKDNIYSNYGFEALTYSDETALFWTCTENFLRQDGDVSSSEKPIAARLRLQSFNKALQPEKEHIYTTDAPRTKRQPRQMAFGVPAITALDDGSLLVLERQFFVAKKYIGSYVTNKIYRVAPFTDKPKTLMAEWTTRLNLTRRNIANYEGMCLGPKLDDGRQTILLISDSQGGYGNSNFHLKDYLRVGIISE